MIISELKAKLFDDFVDKARLVKDLSDADAFVVAFLEAEEVIELLQETMSGGGQANG